MTTIDRSVPRGGCALGLALACGLAQGQPASYDFSQVTALCEGALVGQNVQQPVPGFELVLMKDGVVVYHRAFGQWTRDRVASIDSSTKTLSGALVVAMTDASPQPFSLDTRLSQYIPEFSGPKAAITVRQAFAHVSGLPGGSAAQGDPGLTLQQAAEAIAGGPLPFTPVGQVFAYGGASMHAAGAVVELAGGASWNALFQSRIAGPLGLARTRYVLTSPSNPRIAGGAESTASEFGRFMEMLRRGGLFGTQRVLSEQAVQAMFTRQTPLPPPNGPLEIAGTPLDPPTTDGGDYGVGVWLDERGAQGQLLGALAAGARGFASWIDFDDGMVGVFGTDLTSASNVGPLYYLLRNAAQEAIRAPLACYANCDRSSGAPALTPADFVCFLTRYRAGDPYANCDESTLSPALTPADFVCFLARVREGC